MLVGFHEKSSSYVAEMTGCHILTKNVSDMIMPMRELVSKLSIRQRMPQIEVAVGGNGRTALVFRTLEEPIPPTSTRSASSFPSSAFASTSSRPTSRRSTMSSTRPW